MAERGDLEYPINQELLDDATRVNEEWQLVRDRLAKVDEQKGKVSPVVYERVRRDYHERLKGIEAQLTKKKGEVEREVATLSAAQKKIAAHVEEHRHAMEEIKFRHALGEFDEAEYQEKAKVAHDKIAKFEAILTAVTANIDRYRSVFPARGEKVSDLFADAAAVEAPHAVVSASSKKTPSVELADEEEPVTDDSGFIVEPAGNDYFSGEEATDAGATAKTAAKTKRAAAAPAASGARLIAVAGVRTGESFVLGVTTSLGRAESSTISLSDAKVSRQHAQIQKKGNEYVLTDLNSSNGTFMNGERIEEHVLADGDEIRIGDSLLKFQG